MQMLKRRMICGVVSALFVSAFLLVALKPSMARAELNSANSSSENDQIGSSSELQTQADEGSRWEAYGVYGGKYAYMVDLASKVDNTATGYSEYNSRIVDVDGNVVIDLPIGGTYKEIYPQRNFDAGQVTGLYHDLENSCISLGETSTGLKGVLRLDGSNLIPFKYDFITPATCGLAPFVCSSHDGTHASITYFNMDGTALATISREYSNKTISSIYFRYGSGSYLYDALYVSFAGGGSDCIVVEKQGNSFVERNDLTSPPNNSNSTSTNEDASAFWNTESYKLPNGTTVRYSHEVVTVNSKQQGSVSVVDGEGNPIAIGGGTLGLYIYDCQRAANPSAVMYVESMKALRNSVKHGNADVWWATNASGKWGAVNSSGAVIVPFEYDAYGDRGLDSTDYALVEKDGAWSFLKVTGIEEDKPVTPEPKQSMHRLYNPNSGEHFYTASDAERDHLVSVGWNSEGEGWTAPATSGTPVYRMYNANGGEHHYTPDASERDMLIGVGWNDEGIGWYSDDAQTVPLYRDYNPNAFANNHNYTVDREEHEWLLSLGWRDEGIAWYGV